MAYYRDVREYFERVGSGGKIKHFEVGERD